MQRSCNEYKYNIMEEQFKVISSIVVRSTKRGMSKTELEPNMIIAVTSTDSCYLINGEHKEMLHMTKDFILLNLNLLFKRL